MVLLWNTLLTLRFCWAIKEFTLVWSEIIFEILSNLGAGILPDTDLFGPVWKNMSEGRIYYWAGRYPFSGRVGTKQALHLTRGRGDTEKSKRGERTDRKSTRLNSSHLG